MVNLESSSEAGRRQRVYRAALRGAAGTGRRLRCVSVWLRLRPWKALRLRCVMAPETIGSGRWWTGPSGA